MDPVLFSPVADTDKKAISLLRILAIFSVITAHVNTVVNDGGTLRWIVTGFWNAFGQVGVVCFFILGGFLYHRDAKDGLSFAKKKLFSLVIPWLICAALTYALSCIVSHHISIVSALKWFFGVGTWYYYITVFLVFLFLFKFLWRHEVLLYLCMALTVFSVGMYTFFPELTDLIPLTPYLNVFNWIGFFALGIVARKHNWLTRVKGLGALAIALIGAIVSLGLMFLCDSFGYFHLLSILWELAMTVVLWNISRGLATLRWTNLFVPFGNDTYCIYLLHMQIVQFVSNRLPSNIIFDIAIPFIGTILMFILIFCAKKLVCLFPFGATVCRAVGLRMPSKSLEQK